MLISERVKDCAKAISSFECALGNNDQISRYRLHTVAKYIANIETTSSFKSTSE